MSRRVLRRPLFSERSVSFESLIDSHSRLFPFYLRLTFLTYIFSGVLGDYECASHGRRTIPVGLPLPLPWFLANSVTLTSVSVEHFDAFASK